MAAAWLPISHKDTAVPNDVLTHTETTPADSAPKHGGGPRSEAGKARSSMNSWKHGLTARTALLPTENKEAFDAFAQRIFDFWKPANAMEEMYTQQIVEDGWRLERGTRIEQSMYVASLSREVSEVTS